MPSRCRSFQDLLVVQISCKLNIEHVIASCAMCHYRGLHMCNLYLSNFQTRGAVELLLLCRATIMQAPVIIHTGFIMIVFMPTGM